MQLFKFLLVVGISISLLFLCHSHQPFSSRLPSLGRLFSPFDGFWQNAEQAVQGEFTLELEGVKAPVQVIFDERMVPHIFAQNDDDLFFAQGYVTAMHRLWQMDISIRATSGNLAAVMGPAVLERDILQRKKGLLMAAENAVEAFKSSPLDDQIGAAYTAGVNAYIESLHPADYPIEFKLLNYAPEPWTPLKSAIFFKSMAESLCARHQDLASSNALEKWGRETFDFLFPAYNPKQSPIIPAEVEWNFTAGSSGAASDSEAATPLGHLYKQETFPLPSEFLGSNNWAVSGKKTASGAPILCNDPHLQLTLPSIWFEIQLHTPDFTAYGVSLPGTPSVIIGFNEHIAWGQTNVGHDVLDWYEIEWENDQKEAYIVDGQAKSVQFRYDTIAVRGQAEPHIEQTRLTEWGPVVYEAEGEAYQDLAMRWIAHDKPIEKEFYEVAVFYHLMKGKNKADYFAALKGYDSPAQNFVFASQEGDIALQVNGKFPIKQADQGRFVQAGNRSENAWSGFIPRDQVPMVLNPSRGFVSSANQHSTAPDYPYYYLGGFDDYRGRFINEQLALMEDVQVSDMMALQLNNHSLKAREALPLLLEAMDSIEVSAQGQALLQLLADWDYRYEAEAQAPIFFDKWFAEAYQLTFDEWKEPSEKMDLLYPEAWRFISLIEASSGHEIFDLQESDTRENAEVIIQMAFQEAVKTYEEKQTDPQFDWGHQKGTVIGHLGRIQAFDSELVYTGGTGDAPNAIKARHGPSWRMIVTLGEQVEALGVFPGGQSGNPGSPFYDNTIKTWASGDYYPLYLMKGPSDDRVKPFLTYTIQ